MKKDFKIGTPLSGHFNCCQLAPPFPLPQQKEENAHQMTTNSIIC
jgi:hypothetical protein